MPVRTMTAGHQNQQRNNGSGKNKTGARGPRDDLRSRRDDQKAEGSAPSLSGPIIKTQISNTAKTSSGKSFLDALRVGASQRPPAGATVAVEQSVAARTTPAALLAEPGTSAASEPAVVETAATQEAEVTDVADATNRVVDEPSVVEHKSVTQLQEEQRPVILPETDAHFSWANDDDYSFVNQFTKPVHEEAAASEAPTFLVRYPQAVLDAQKNPCVVFKAPEDHQTLLSAFSALEKQRQELDNARREFDEYCKKREIDMNEKQAQLLALERQLKDQSESLQQERSKLLGQQQQQKQQQLQHQHHHHQHQHQHQHQHHQQHQQQQQSPLRPATTAPQTSTHHVPPPGSNYTYAPPPMQENIQWGHPPRAENWTLNHGISAPPYEHNRYYSGNYQPPRCKPFGGRGGGDAPAHMGRGSQMRAMAHMQSNFNSHPMVGGEVRAPAPDSGVNPMFGQRSQAGYMQSNNFHNQW